MVIVAIFRMGDKKYRLACCAKKLEADWHSWAGPTAGMTMGFHGIVADATEFVHFSEILPQEIDYSMFFHSLGEKPGVLVEDLPSQNGDHPLNTQSYNGIILNHQRYVVRTMQKAMANKYT